MIKHFEMEYFDWMYELVCGGRLVDGIGYNKLLRYLHSVEFIHLIKLDRNRADDGVDLRLTFAYDKGYDTDIKRYISGPCSVLEMMIALSIRCEDIMDNPEIGDRTGQWFWRMIVNLGLGDMTDDHFDQYVAEEVIECFLNRQYEADGRGGLFFIPNCSEDLRDMEIWKQMCYFLNTIYC